MADLIHKCDQCPYTSRWDFALKHHQDHHGITPKSLEIFSCIEEPKKYECTSCDYRTPMSRRLMQHIRTEHKSKTLPLINVVVSDDIDRVRKQNKTRVKNSDLTRTDLKCPVCNFLRVAYIFLRKHKTPACTPKFIELDDLSVHADQGVSQSMRRVVDLHKQLDTNVTVYQFKCLHCYRGHDDNLPAFTTLLRDRDTFKCYHCSYETNKKMYLKAHITNKHTLITKIVWHQCEHCPYKTKTKNLLERHRNFTHTNLKNFPCELCPYKAKYKSHLEKHVLSMHTSDRLFACGDCSYKAKNKTALNYHIKARHVKDSEINWFSCEHCTYRARWKHLIRLHSINKHLAPENIRWHQCQHCTYKAKRSTHLKLHIGRKHAQL